MTITVTNVANTQTFGAWLTTTNRLANLMTQNTVTADSSNGGSVTTGNSFVNGHFGASFVHVSNTLIGGNISSNGVLTIQANLAITNGTSNVLIVTANSTTSNVRITSDNITFLPTGNVNLGGDTFVVNAANVSFSGANISFTNSPLSGNVSFSGANISFTNSPLSGNLTFNSNTVYNGSVIIANGLFGSNGTVLFSNGTGMYWNSIPSIDNSSGILINEIAHQFANTFAFNNSVVAANVDTVSASTYRSFEYLIQLSDVTTPTPRYHVTKISVIHDGTTPYMTEYGTLFNVSSLGTFNTIINGGNIALQLTPVTANVVAKFIRTSIVP